MDIERFVEQAIDLANRVSSDARERRRRRRKRRRRAMRRFFRTAGMMALAALLIVFTMLATGRLLGPRGVEGLLALPILLGAAWAVILYVSRAGKPSLQSVSKSDLAELPAHTEEWLERQRWSLPPAARSRLDAIALRLEALTPQLARLDPAAPAALEVRRLLADELPELVHGYQKVPATLQQKPLHGGPSPDRQLLDGLATIDEEIGRMHARLAADDLHALATQRRFLETKYKRDDKLE
jgi:hypothetical protein